MNYVKNKMQENISVFEVDVSGFVWAFKGYQSHVWWTDVSVLYNASSVVPFCLFLICIVQHSTFVGEQDKLENY